MAFHEVRLPARLAFGSTGGIERRTEVVTLASGHERRSSPWAEGRRRWLIGAGVRSLDDMALLSAFFEARRGRLYGFRFRDFADFKSCAPGGTPAATDQVLGVGDGARTAFQLLKVYGDADPVTRAIRKPVAGAARVAVGGVELAASAFSVSEITGVATLSQAPAAGAVVTAGYAFDTPVRFDADRIDMTPVRFDADRIDMTLEGFGAGRMAAVPLIEIRT